jgi:hypothetical protein
MTNATRVGGALALLVLVGCVETPPMSVDGGTDASTDAAMAVDAGVDASMDAETPPMPVDGGVDASMDAAAVDGGGEDASCSDADGDGRCDAVDVCPGADDGADADGDDVPDGCDACPYGDDRLDGDGDGTPDACATGTDEDQDGTPDGFDCRALDPFAQPGAAERCNGADDDCDGIVDEGACAGCEAATFRGSRYLQCHWNVDADTANAHCARLLRGMLASIDDADENAFALSVRGGLITWLGATDRELEGTFVWRDGRPVVYSSWEAGEPNDLGGNEECVELRELGRWNDEECSRGRSFLCESGCTGVDTDLDGTPDPCDPCPRDAADDADGDGRCADVDPCPLGFDVSTDDDLDGLPDSCDEDSVDLDGDGVRAARDECPYDAVKTAPGACGCGMPDVDADGDGSPDCAAPCRTFVRRGHTYRFCATARTWAAADADCASAGLRLVILDDVAEQRFVWERIAAHLGGRGWLGLTDVALEGEWRWWNGAPLAFTSWRAGDPDGGLGESCGHFAPPRVENPFDPEPVIVAPEGWVDASCGASVPYVCETPP